MRNACKCGGYIEMKEKICNYCNGEGCQCCGKYGLYLEIGCDNRKCDNYIESRREL